MGSRRSRPSTKGGQLHADHAAADDDQAFVEGLSPVQQLVAGHRQLQAWDGRPGGDGARGAEDIGAGVFGLALGIGNLDPACSQDGAGAPEELHLGGFQKRLHAAPQLLHHGLLPGKNGRQVKADVLRMDAEDRGFLGLVVDFASVQQGLGGDTAPVEAGAAHVPALHQCRLQAQLGRMQRGLVAAGTRADDDQIIVVHRMVSFSVG